MSEDPERGRGGAFACPECGGRQRGARPGAIVPCVHCKNPVVVPARPQARPATPAVATPAPAGGGVVPTDPVRKLWATALGVVLVVGLAHLGLYLLLTGEARESLREIEQRHSVAQLQAAVAPDAPPPPGTPAFRPWLHAKELWGDAARWRTDRRQVDLLRSGFLGSFVVQAALTCWILVRLLATQRKRRAAAQRA